MRERAENEERRWEGEGERGGEEKVREVCKLYYELYYEFSDNSIRVYCNCIILALRKLFPALGAFASAPAGNRTRDLCEVIPYFATPCDGRQRRYNVSPRIGVRFVPKFRRMLMKCFEPFWYKKFPTGKASIQMQNVRFTTFRTILFLYHRVLYIWNSTLWIARKHLMAHVTAIQLRWYVWDDSQHEGCQIRSRLKPQGIKTTYCEP